MVVLLFPSSAPKLVFFFTDIFFAQGAFIRTPLVVQFSSGKPQIIREVDIPAPLVFKSPVTIMCFFSSGSALSL